MISRIALQLLNVPVQVRTVITRFQIVPSVSGDDLSTWIWVG